MPKILINEKDRTSPGTPSSYSNYAVLIPGFRGTATNASVEPDTNGVYEFNSAQAFKDTIGLVAPEITQETDSGTVTVYHYGNQMAYELLKLGYPVIYKPITNINTPEVYANDSEIGLADSKFWEIFKDKASYDFRFVTHGLLESSNVADEAVYTEAQTRLTLVNNAIAELERIDANFELAEEKNDEYLLTFEDFEGFKYEDAFYANYNAAKDGTTSEKNLLTATLDDLIGGGISKDTINQVNGHIANLAKRASETETAEEIPGRGDCIALIELDEKSYSGNVYNAKAENLIINAINEMSQINADNGKYCALTVPSVHYNMTSDVAFKDNKKFPGAFHYLACFINSLKLGFAEWYAAAGYTRGVSSYIIDHTTVKLGEIAINALEPRNLIGNVNSVEPKFACNVIANFRGSYYLWGNRTAHPLGKKGSLETGDLVASSFLNIRQLCTTIKKQLYIACSTFTFDPNSDTLWVNFVNAIKPTLEAMKADQGIRDYKILKVYTDTKATLKAKIRIIPIEAVEDFDLEVSLEDSFGETAAVVTE